MRQTAGKGTHMKTRILSALLALALLLSLCACAKPETPATQPADPSEYNAVLDTSLTVDERIEAQLAKMTLKEKAAQMVQGQDDSVRNDFLQYYPIGSVLRGGGSIAESAWSAKDWKSLINGYQRSSLMSPAAIPIIFGIDAVHGNNKINGAVIFPHNIGIGAANDPELTRLMGEAVANEMKIAGMRLDFAPCVALADDPRWGRTYESYSTETEIVTSLSVAFSEGLLAEGVMPTAKHYLGDGNTNYGTGTNGTILDRGDSTLTEDEIRERLLPAYKALIDAGVMVVMPSFSSIEGVDMHENKYWITDVLKGELGFEGFIITDWEAAHEVSGSTFDEQVINTINAGIDMLMEPSQYSSTINIIVKAVENGDISEERIDDAVTRILRVKFEMGLFDDPLQEKVELDITELGSDEYRDLAKQLVSKSLVLLKNDGAVLPLKDVTVFVTGPALDDMGAQCGGWTASWQGQLDAEAGALATPGTTILDGLNEYASEYGVTFITDESKIGDADVVLIAVGERPYAEWEGDSEDISLTGSHALNGNKEAIELAKKSGKPTIALIVAGRQVMIDKYLGDWDAAVMCYLPGSEGDGVASVLFGENDFSGKLPMPWYKSVNDIGKDDAKLLFETGYGLSYNG